MQRKNLTLSLPSELIQAAKVHAAKRGTSINALVKESLEQMVEPQDDYMEALKRILDASRKGLYRSSRKVPRSELYD
ncbi:MAG: CopG family transcriptional regulator [Acidobacteria bacterium]|nr:CopG family transcriptional regulator [Acidobacteriota bacterium]